MSRSKAAPVTCPFKKCLLLADMGIIRYSLILNNLKGAKNPCNCNIPYIF